MNESLLLLNELNKTQDLSTELQKIFEQKFERPAEGVYFSPARLNIIGEHIDYNGGHSLPLAITLGTYAAYALREDGQFNFASLNMSKGASFESSELEQPAREDWSDYVRGMLLELRKKGLSLDGIDLLIYGNVPNGAGLSSSASLELLIGKLVQDLSGAELSGLDLALCGQAVENNFIGVNSGLMDQVAIALAKKAHAVLFHAADLSFRHCPIELENTAFLVLNSNKRRELRESKYNERRAESEKLDRILTEANLLVDSGGDLSKGTRLCQIELKSLAQAEAAVKAAVPAAEAERLCRRLRHVISEEERVRRTVEALAAGEPETIGKILIESHRSLAEDYEVTGPELDALVEAANLEDAVYGARMCGAGFGGSAIALVDSQADSAYMDRIVKNTVARSGLKPDLFLVQDSGGPRRLA
ncbi:MAG: galactokinase [Eubacteriales bacterium]|nr:galactokinase [Eubacteriales bacterium]